MPESELNKLAVKMSEQLNEETIQKLYEDFDYLPLFNRVKGVMGWIYPDGTFHESLPNMADLFQQIIG